MKKLALIVLVTLSSLSVYAQKNGFGLKAGLSSTQVETLDDNTAITYDDILTFNAYINVHLSAAQLGTIVSQGNIGSNE